MRNTIKPNKGSHAGALMAIIAAGTSTAFGQSVLAPPPSAFSVSPVADPLADRSAGQTDADVIESTLYGGAGAMQWGIAHLHPRLMYRLSYGDGIQSTPGQQQKTVIHELLPGAFLKIGKNWLLDYSPSIRFYMSGPFKDTFDQNVVFSGGTVYQDWAFNLSQGYSYTSQPLVQTGVQTDEEAFSTDVGATWSINEVLSLQLGINQHFRFLNGDQANGQLTDSRSWSNTDWLNYQWAPGLSTAVGLSLGYDDVSTGSDMTNEQLLARVAWLVQRRLSLSLMGGGELRQYLDSNVGNSLNPIVRGGIDYQLFEQTRLSLSCSHSTSPSYFSNETTETTEVSAGLQQRLLGSLTLSLSGGLRWYS